MNQFPLRLTARASSIEDRSPVEFELQWNRLMVRQENGLLSPLPNPRFTRVERFDGRNIVRVAAWILAPQLAVALAAIAAKQGLGIDVFRPLYDMGLGFIKEWVFPGLLLLTLLACPILLPTVLVRRRPAVVLEFEVDEEWVEGDYWLNEADSPGLETLVDEMERRA
ncbi:hypothetical protein ABI59_11175 [Acidobacteria bacterium Mor1]|nr:hypothetical protein ABI59_11175 [Acidobacteria bacterium Mor1]